MPDDIQRMIYKLEIDDSGYIRGIESLNNSTKKLTAEQERTNQVLKTNEAALKTQSEFLQQTKKDLDSYTGTNERYRQQLQKSFKDAQADNIKLTELVNNNRKAYELAQKAAQEFANISARATQLQQQTTGGKIPTTAPAGISTPIEGISGLPEIILESKNEFDQLRVAIGLAEERMNALNKEDEEFKNLAPIVKQGKDALLQYDNAAKLSGESTLSLRSQITKGREELVRLEEAGKGTSQEFITLEKNVAKLTNAFEDQRNRIKVLASETRLLDFGKAAIQSAISGFQVYTSVAVLAGGASEELQKKTLQLFAAMQLLTSLEQLAAQVKRGGVIATNLQSAAQSVYTAVVGASTGALRAFRIALLATGIGAAAVIVGLLVKKFIDMRNAANEAAEGQKRINDAMKAGESEYVRAVTEVTKLRNEIDLAKKGFIDKKEVVKEYNETIGKTTGSVKDLDGAEKGLIDNADNYIKFTLFKAAANFALGEAAKKVFEIEQNILTRDPVTATDIRRDAFKNATKEDIKLFNDLGAQYDSAFLAGDKKRADAIKAQRDSIFNQFAESGVDTKLKKDQKAFEEIAKNFQQRYEEIAKGFKVTVTPQKTTIDNVFEEEKAAMLAKLSELRNNEAENIAKINKEFADKLVVEKLRIEKLIKDKKLTGNILDEKSQAGILFTLSIQINEKERDKKIEAFRKSIIDARNKLNDELNNLESKNIQDNLNLIHDEFDRRAALIDFNEKKELSNAEENNQKRLDALDFERLLIGEQAYQDAKARIISAGELQALNILQRFANERQDLAADTFDTFFTFIDDEISRIDLVKDQQIAKGVQEAKAKFLAGEIQFAEFEKRIAALKRTAENKARADTLFIQQAELADLQTQIDSIEDKTTKHYKSLVKKAEQLKKDIAAAQSNTSDVEDPNRRQVETVQQYAEAIGAVTASVIAFWQKANEAETQALDRSIALQEKRVEAAQRIAERGNAQYLKQEQDRLTQLNVQRENAARKQLGIDAALQASQLLVGITGAISKIASGIGAAETIAEIAIIVGALATGYGLVKSLQGNQPKLKTGTTYVSRGKNKPGTDTIPAWLDEGEAVTSAEKNKAYHPVIKAIHGGTIPAETLNEFVENYSTTKNVFKTITSKEIVNNSYVEKIVNNVITKQFNDFVTTYHKIKSVPQLDYNKIKDTAELHISQDGKMVGLLNALMENNQLQKETIKSLKARAVNVNMDKEGFAMSFMEVVAKNERDKRI